MLRRLNIAAGLLHDPKVVLMDEPTVGLDPQTRASILELVRVIAAGGAAVVYTTHYLDEAERLCDRIGIIDHGVDPGRGHPAGAAGGGGRPGDHRPARDVRRRRGGARDAEAPGVRADQGRPTPRCCSRCSGPSRRWPALLAVAATLGTVREVAIRQPSLENLFIKLTGRELRE